MNTFAFTLDLSKTAYMEPLRIRQGDHNGTTVQATILDHGVALDGSYTARFCMRHPGTGATYYRETGTYANGVATVALDEQYAASVPGRTTAYIQLLQGSTVIASTSDIPVVILRDATEDAVPGEVYDSAIEDALAELDEATGRISIMVQEQVAEELAAHPEWTTTVQDNSVTDAKLIQSGGILSRNQRLMYRLANLLTNRTDEGTLAAISDAAKTPIAGLSVYGLSTQDGTPTPSAPVPIVSVEGDSEGNISLLARGKNLFKLGTIYGENVATAAISGDSVTVTATAASGWSYVRFRLTIPSADADYCLSFTPSSASSALIGVDFMSADDTRISYVSTNTSGTTFHVPADTAYLLVALYSRRTNSGSVGDANTYSNIQLEAGTTATAYQPYVTTTTPIDLDGHELRSLPDGTRDELTVDAEGHVTLVQRVGVVTFDGSSDETWKYSSSSAYSDPTNGKYCYYADVNINGIAMGSQLFTKSLCSAFSLVTQTEFQSSKTIGTYTFSSYANYPRFTVMSALTTVDAFESWLSSTPVTVLYPLVTPVTHDLGTVPLVPLVGPDLTAQTVPSAPFVLDAERDLNVTLARLESAIADVATS